MPMRSLTADRLRCLQPRLLCTDPDWRPFGHFRIADLRESGIIAIAFNNPLQSWCAMRFRGLIADASLAAPGCSRDSTQQAGHSARRCARRRTSRCRSCGPAGSPKISMYCPAPRRPAVESLALRPRRPPAENLLHIAAVDYDLIVSLGMNARSCLLSDIGYAALTCVATLRPRKSRMAPAIS
jgi:hypothetical protein